MRARYPSQRNGFRAMGPGAFGPVMVRVQRHIGFRARGWIGAIALAPLVPFILLSVPVVREESWLDLAIDGIAWIVATVMPTANVTLLRNSPAEHASSNDPRDYRGCRHSE